MSLDATIVELVKKGFYGTQTDFRDVLKDEGFDVNQSTISRTLKKLGAAKVDGKWTLDQTTGTKRPGNFADHITGVTRNEQLIIIKTIPGSANFVASFLDHSDNNQVLGTIAGDDCLLIIPRSVNAIRQCLKSVSEDLGIHHGQQ